MRLRIVSFNDVYTLENLPRMKNLVREALSEIEGEKDSRAIVVLAGDFLAPSILSSIDAGRAMVECLNAVGVTHVIFGNHEDDVPIESLRARVRELHASVIATNVRGFVPELPGSDVIDINGLRVGLVGVVMNDPAVYRRPPFGVARVLDPNPCALEEAATLRASGCATVVPITHQSIEADRALAGAAKPPFPAIIGGHEHVVEIEQVASTWIVKAGTDAEHAAVVDLTWSTGAPGNAGALGPMVTVRLLDAAAYPDDPALRAIVDRHMQSVHDLECATLIVLGPDRVLSSIGTRSRQTSMGALVCSRVRDALGADACIFNGGGIRGGREYRDEVTYGDLKAEVPFDNEVVVVRIPGGVLKEAVRYSRARGESGGFLQVDDAMIVADGTNELVRIAGAPLDETREYAVALVRDLLLGMDHIEPLERFAKSVPERVPPPASGREIKMVLVDALSVALWRTLGGFDAVDVNHDGVVTESEIAAAVAKVTRKPASPITANLVMSAIDKDHDHAISKSEAAAIDGPITSRGNRS